MLLEGIPMLVRRFDSSDSNDTDFETEPGLPLPFGLPRLYIETENSAFRYQQNEVSREWVNEWINRDPSCAFWIIVDGNVYAAGNTTYYAVTKKMTIPTPLTFYYRLKASLVSIEDRTTLEDKPVRAEVYAAIEAELEDEEDPSILEEVGDAVSRGLSNNTRFESGEIVIATLRHQLGFKNVRIINEAHAEHLFRLVEVLPSDTKRMNEIELSENVRKRLAQDLKQREALPLNLSDANISRWENLSDVVDDVDWHMHIR